MRLLRKNLFVCSAISVAMLAGSAFAQMPGGSPPPGGMPPGGGSPPAGGSPPQGSMPPGGGVPPGQGGQNPCNFTRDVVLDVSGNGTGYATLTSQGGPIFCRQAPPTDYCTIVDSSGTEIGPIKVTGAGFPNENNYFANQAALNAIENSMQQFVNSTECVVLYSNPPIPVGTPPTPNVLSRTFHCLVPFDAQGGCERAD